MKNFKKVLALVLAVACLLSFAAVASANNAIKTSEVYDDAASISAEYTEAIDVLTAIGVLDGKGTGYKPKDTLKRSEAAKIIAVFANTDPEINSLYASANPFTDVPANHWAVSYIAYAYKTGIIAGVKDGVFAPDARLTGIQFLKMVLCVLGYDAHEEGLVGTSWKVNTLQLAKNAGLLEVLGNNYNFDTELTREAAAQIMLNALNANTVSYGNAVKVASTMRNYQTVAGAVANSEFMYQKWNLRKLTNGTDPFGRPGHKWLLNNTAFGKDMYTDAPLASYTVKVAGCQILTDCIFDTTNPTGTKTLRVWTNGVQNGSVTVADTTELRYGAQGRLTEVYEDRIVYIDTFLAQVKSVTPGRTDAQGHIIREAVANVNVFIPTNNNTGYATVAYTFIDETAASFVKDQYVRVTGTFGDVFVNVAGAVNRPEGTIITMDTVETKQGALAGYTRGQQPAFSQIKLNEEYMNVANGFGFNLTAEFPNKWMGIELVAFMDQYGNILGLDKYWAALNYGVIDALWLASENGRAVLKADFVTMGGELLSGVTVAKITRDGVEYTSDNFVYDGQGTSYAQLLMSDYVHSAAYAEAFKPYYDTLAFFTVNMNGQYELTLAAGAQGQTPQFDQETTDYYGRMYGYDLSAKPNQVIEFTSNYAWGQIATTTNGVTTKTSVIPMDANTIVLVRGAFIDVPFAAQVAGGYTSYTGYANIPAMTANKVSYHINTTTGYADVVYVSEISVTGTKATVFAAGDAVAITGITYDAKGEKNYNYAVTVYVVDEATGALTKGTYTMSSKQLNLPVPAIGFHTAYINANNEISFGIDNANYGIANANYMGITWNVVRNAVLGPNAYQITDGATFVEITNITSTTHGYSLNDDDVSEVNVVGNIELDVLDGDTVYVYQNNNNPANPIYCVVDAFAPADVWVSIGGNLYAAGTDAFKSIISSYNVGFAGRSWEAAYAVTTPNYQVLGMTNDGCELLQNAYGYFYDVHADAPVGEVIIYVEAITDQNYNALLVDNNVGLVQVNNATRNITIYGNTTAGNLAAELANMLDYNSRNATVEIQKYVIGQSPVKAETTDPVAPGMIAVVTSANGLAQTVYYITVNTGIYYYG